MRNHELRLSTWRAPVGALALLALVAGTAFAADPASMAYNFSSHPMISGTVVTVNDHQMVVNTDQGEQVTLELDTRTMAPRDLGPGMVMRADFRALEDCRLYATSINPVRGSASTERSQVYANTQDSPEVVTRNATASGSSRNVSWQVAGSGGRVTSPQGMREHSTGATMIATPSTRDYIHSTRPMVSGEVLSVNDHRLVVRSYQGQRVGMVMDSQTMLPGAVGPGTSIRAEFNRLKDGRYLAKEISLVDDEVADREQAYANTLDSDILVAENVTECGAVFATSNPVTAYVEPRQVLGASTERPAQTEPTSELPQTGSGQPLMLLLGIFGLGAAGVVKFFRGFRAA